MKNRSETVKGYAAVLGTALLWSIGGLFIKLVPWAAMSINAARCFVAMLVKTGVRRSVRIRFSPKVILAGVCFAGMSTFFTLANKYTTSANAILLQYSAPLFVMLFAWLHTGKRPRLSDGAISVAIIAGIALCCMDSLGGGSAVGNIYAVLAGVCFALMLYVNALPGADPDSANYLGFLLSVLVGLPALLRETVFTVEVLGCIFVLGAFQSGAAYMLMEYGITRVSALSVLFISAIEPILNPVWVAVFYGETIGPLAVLGGVLVIAASTLHSVLESGAEQTAQDAADL